MDNSNISLLIDECPQWTEDELFIYDRFKFWCEIVGGVSISTVGMCFNTIAIIVILSMNKRQNIFNYLLICLLATDSVYLFFCVSYEILDHIITSDRWFNLIYPKIIHPLINMSVTLSIFLTVAISHERFIAVQYPIVHSQKMKSAKSRKICLLKYLIVTILLSIIFHLPKFFEIDIVWVNENSTEDIGERPSKKYLRYFPRFVTSIADNFRYNQNRLV